MSKFKVDGKFSTRAAKEGSPQLPACEPDILPPRASEAWKPRTMEQITIPSPVMRRSLFGHLDHSGFQQEVREVEQSEKAVTSLVRTRTEKEQAIVEHERALARREMMPALIEQDRLAVVSEVVLARAALRRTVEHIGRQQDADRQAAINDGRIRELETLEYETELARKHRVLTEEKEKAAGAEEIAAVMAQAERTKAQRELREQESELEKAQRKANLAKERRVESEVGQGADTDELEPAAFRRELARGSERERIRKAARAREADILAAVGGDEAKLSQGERDRLEEIRSAEYRTLQRLDLTAATGTTFPDADEKESQ